MSNLGNVTNIDSRPVKVAIKETAVVNNKENKEDLRDFNIEERNTNIVIIGSNFLAATLLVASMGFNDSNVTVIDRKDPYALRYVNGDVDRIMDKLMPNVTTRNFYHGDIYGDKPNKKTISFVFKDWVNEDISIYLEQADIVIYAGAIYDSLYAKYNPLDTLHVANKGIYNVLSQLEDYRFLNEKRTLFIFMSSINVYGDQSHDETSLEIDETTPPNPQSIIDLSLYNQENMVRAMLNKEANERGIDWLILRLGNLCGDHTPHTSLLTAACKAFINKEPTFTVWNADNSIELLHINDLFFLITAIIKKYRQIYHDNQNEEGQLIIEKEKEEKEYLPIVNQIYNVKADEKEEKTVIGIVRALFGMESTLPAITKDHKIGRYKNYRMVAPRILRISSSGKKKPTVKFGKPVMASKVYEKLGFISSESLSYVMRHTMRYVLNHLSPDISETEKDAIAKILYIIRTPDPGRARREGAKDSVVDSVSRHMNRVEKVMSESNKPVVDEKEDDDKA